MQNRWKSITAWITLLPVIIILADTYGLWNIIQMPKDTFTKLLAALGTALVAFGIFNNPTNKTGF